MWILAVVLVAATACTSAQLAGRAAGRSHPGSPAGQQPPACTARGLRVRSGLALPGAGLSTATVRVTVTNDGTEPCSFPVRPALVGMTATGALVPVGYRHPGQPSPAKLALAAGTSASSSWLFGSCAGLARADRAPVRSVRLHLASKTALAVTLGATLACLRAVSFSEPGG
jgi:hypothetical protein